MKSISRAGIPEAIAKVELYRYLNEPEEAESICRDILAVDPEHQLARRMLGLAITDQFTGFAGDRYAEVAWFNCGHVMSPVPKRNIRVLQCTLVFP